MNSYLRAIVEGETAITSAASLTRYGFTSATAAIRAKAALIEKDVIDTLSTKPEIQDPVYAYWLTHTYFHRT